MKISISAYKCSDGLEETGIKSKSGKLLQKWLMSGTKWKDDPDDKTSEPESVTKALEGRILDFSQHGDYARYKIESFNYEIRNVDLKAIKPIHQNADAVSQESIDFTAKQIKKNDFDTLHRKHDVLPILLGFDGSILDGYHRFNAAKTLKEKTIPALVPVRKGKGKITNIVDFANYGVADIR